MIYSLTGCHLLPRRSAAMELHSCLLSTTNTFCITHSAPVCHITCSNPSLLSSVSCPFYLSIYQQFLFSFPSYQVSKILQFPLLYSPQKCLFRLSHFQNFYISLFVQMRYPEHASKNAHLKSIDFILYLPIQCPLILSSICLSSVH